MRALWAVLLAGCQLVFSPEEAEEGEVALPACTTPGGLDDDFRSSVEACRPWGVVSEFDAAVDVEGGRVLISPAANVNAFGGCISEGGLALGPTGAVLDVTAALFGAATEQSPTYAVFHAYPVEPAGALVTNIKQEYGRLGFYLELMPVGVLLPYDPIAMRWWRISPALDGSGLVGEYSADGVAWRLLGKANGVVPASVRVDFGAGTTVGISQPGIAEFGHIQVCAP